jgi:hypothetical protein
VLAQQRQPLAQEALLQERRSGIDATGMGQRNALADQLFQGMADHRMGGRMVVGQVRRATERHLRPVLARHRFDFRVVSADHHLIEQATGQCHTDRMGNDRQPGKGLEILARDAFAATTGRNDRDVVFPTLSHASSPRRLSTT